MNPQDVQARHCGRLTVPELHQFLTRVTYLDGYTIRVYEGRHEGPHLQIRADVDDAYNPHRTVTLDVHSSIPPMHSTDQFAEWLLWRLERLANHETREHFKVDGQPWDNPHADGADQDR